MTDHVRPKKLAVIDGKSIFYRGYYAMPGLSLPDGTPTGGPGRGLPLSQLRRGRGDPASDPVAQPDRRQRLLRRRLAEPPGGGGRGARGAAFLLRRRRRLALRLQRRRRRRGGRQPGRGQPHPPVSGADGQLASRSGGGASRIAARPSR